MLIAYIFKEFIFPFLLAFMVITLLLALTQIYRFLPNLKAIDSPWRILFTATAYMLPPVWRSITLLCSPLAIYLGISRLSSDSEIISMLTSGASIITVIKAAFLFSLVTGTFLFLQNFYLAPKANVGLTQLKNKLITSSVSLKFENNKINNVFQTNMVFVKGKTDNSLQNLIIANWIDPLSNPIIEAKQGSLMVNKKERLFAITLEKGSLYQLLDRFKTLNLVSFDSLLYQIPLLEIDTTSKNTDARYSSLNDLARYIIHNQEPQNRFLYVYTIFARLTTVLALISLGIFASLLGITNPRMEKNKNKKLLLLIASIWIFFLIYTMIRSYCDSIYETQPPSYYGFLFFISLIPSIGFSVINYLCITRNLSLLQLFKLKKI